MAGDWIGIDHELPERPEVLRLHEATGVPVDAILGRLFLLWRLFDRQTMDGTLPGIGPRGLAALLPGGADFWQAVADVGWLEFNGEGATVPDFSRRFGDSARSRMKASLRKREERRRKRDSSVTEPGLERDSGVTEVGPSQSLSQSLSESESESESPPESEPQGTPADAGVCRARAPDIDAVVARWCEYHPQGRPGARERRKISDRLREGYSVGDLKEAVDGCHKTPHNLGANERDTKYLALELIMRNSDQVARFIENNRDPPRPRNEKERRVLEASERWLERMEKDGQLQP